MTNALATIHSSITLWEDDSRVQEIRKLFAPTLSEIEFQIFVGLGRASGLNPFTREIWAVKYDKSQAAQIFIGRDGYRKAAQSHKEYDYHQCDAVYENDKFSVVDGEPRHEYTLSNRGKLVGAYCIAKRHKSSRPVYVFVDVNEYSTGKSVWRDKPATMIKKVAESQCLRACFQDLLGGTYGEEEMPKSSENEVTPVSKSNQLLNKIKETKGKVIDINAEKETGEAANNAQLKSIHEGMKIVDFSKDRLDKALAHYGVAYLGQLTSAQAEDFISVLNREADREKE